MRDPDFTLSAGPVAATPRVLAALGSPIVYHYDPAFIERFRATERKLKDVFLTKNDVLLMQGEAVLGLEAAARGLVQPGTKVLNLVQGVFGKGMGYWLKDFGAELHEVEVAYNDAVDPADVERYLDEHPGIELVTVVHSETPSGTWCDIAAIGPIAHQRGALTLVDCVSSIGGMPLEADAWHLDVCVGGAQKCLGGPPGMSLMTVSDAAWERIRANPAAPRASYLSMLDWKEQWIDGEKFPFTPSVSDIYGVEAAADELLEEGPGELDRAARALGGGVPRRRARDGPRALAAQRRGRGGLRDRDHRPRRPHGRAGARPLPRAVRRDGLRGPGRREPRPHRAHGPVGAVAAPGRRARGARSHLRRPRRARSRSAPGSRLPWPSSPRPSRRSRDLRLAHARRLVRVAVRRLARPGRDRGAHARARDHRRRRLLSRPRVRPRGRRVDPGAVRALLGEPARARLRRGAARVPRPPEVHRPEAAPADRRLPSRTTRPCIR